MTPAEFTKARESLGLTQPQTAKLMGYTGERARQTISDFESGRRPVPDNAARWMRAFLAGYRPEDWPVMDAVSSLTSPP